MSKNVILALDQGSSASRVLALDMRGKIVARASRELCTVRQAAHLAELDATALLQGQLEALQEVVAQLENRKIIALSVASQRSTVIFWDKQTGKSLAPALSWQDGRADVPVAVNQLGQTTIHSLTGLYATPFYSAAKIQWALQHIPAVAQAAQANRLCVGPVASYIIWHLTKGKTFACDPTLAQRMLLFDIRKMDWSEELLNAFGIKKEWLPVIKNTSADYGVWNYNGQEIALCACVGDQQAALYALEVKEGDACINYGTGAFFMSHTGATCHIFPGLLTSVAASQKTADYEYLLEGPVNACATVFAWLTALGIEAKQEQLDVLCAASKQPISLLPALGGLGAPYWDFKLTPVMAGLSAQTTRADIILGALRAITNLLADIVFYASKCGIQTREIKVAGGLSKSKSLLQNQADILQISLTPCVERESTALGAALLAAHLLKIDTSVWSTLKTLPVVKPCLSAEQAQLRYQQWRDFVEWCKSYK